MALYDYLIIGGGMTAASAAQGIREVDPVGKIGIISDEGHRPYNRPPLSKKLWQGKPETGIFRKIPDKNLDIFLNKHVITIDPRQNEVRDQENQLYGYRRLLLATGGRPRRLQNAPEDILYLRTLDDYHTARKWTGKGSRIGIIGGGFIGSEIGASLSGLGEKVVMVFQEEGIGARVFPPDLSQFVTDYYRQKGVEVYSGVEIQAIAQRGKTFIMQPKDGQPIEVDHIIAGIGIQPNIELAQTSGVAIAGREGGGGIIVDQFLRTNYSDIFAAGDVASFDNIDLHRQMRVEHEDNANSMGKTAGMNMAGQETAYLHHPFFYSDLFDLGYEGIGELDSRHDIIADWKDPFREGVVYYLKDRKVRGVLLWNTWGQVDAARKLIADGKVQSKAKLKGAIPGKS